MPIMCCRFQRAFSPEPRALYATLRLHRLALPAARFALKKREYAEAYSLFFNGRGDWIRTSGLYVPNVALYQAEPHLEKRLPNGAWLRKKDSNPHIQSQSLLCYLYTIPQYLLSNSKIHYTKISGFVNPFPQKSALFVFFTLCYTEIQKEGASNGEKFPP